MLTALLALLVALSASATESDSGISCPEAPAETVLPDGTCDRGPVTERCDGACPDFDSYVADAGSSITSLETCDGGWKVVGTLAGPESGLWAYFDPDGRIVAFTYNCFLCCCGVCCGGSFTEQYRSRWGAVPSLTGCVELTTTNTTAPPTSTTSSSNERKGGCGCAGGAYSAPIGAVALLGIALAHGRRRRLHH